MRPDEGSSGTPRRVRLLSQVIRVETAENLHCAEGTDEGLHTHRAYGVYDEAAQSIVLDDAMGFERVRETFLHENLHAMFSVTQLDELLTGKRDLNEHVVSVLAPVLLSWLRDNPKAVKFLREKHP